MTDILGSLAGGYQYGQQQFAANEKARADASEQARKAAMEDAKFQLDVANASRLATGAAESAANEITTMINDENWDPALTNQALERAARFDATHGKIWKGGSMIKTVSEALHLNKTKAKDEKGVEVEVADDLFGFVSPEQKLKSDERKMKTQTALVAGQIRPMARDALEKTRGPDGMYDIDKAFSTLSALEASVYEDPNNTYDEATLQAVFDDIWSDLAATNKARLDAMGGGAGGGSAELGVASNRLTTWMKGLMGLDKDSVNFDADMFATREPVALEVDEFMNRMLLAGASEPAIKVAVTQKFRDQAGSWIKNPDALKWARDLGNGPRGLVNAANAATEDGLRSGALTNESMVEPVYQNGEGWLIDKTTGGGVQFWPPPPPAMEIAPPPVEIPGMLRPNQKKAEPAPAKAEAPKAERGAPSFIKQEGDMRVVDVPSLLGAVWRNRPKIEKVEQ